MHVWFYALGSVSLVSVISLLGVLAIPIRKETLSTVKFYLVSLATGAMLGNALVHLIPESFEGATNTTKVSCLIVAGFVICYVIEKVLNLRCHHATGGHCHDGHDEHEHEESMHGHQHHIHPTGWMAMISHGMDNFTDGALIAVSFLNNVPAGIATTIAIVLHEIPMEFGGFGVLVNAGFKRWQAIGINFGSAMVATFATLLTLIIGTQVHGAASVLTPLGAGQVLYITAAGLIPQLQDENDKRKSLIQFAVMMLGITVMVLAKLVD